MADKRRKPQRKIPLSRYPFSPSTYPGRRPRFSFFFTSKGIFRLKFPTLNRLLVSRALPPTTERYAIPAYGSNACPGQLLSKKLSDVPMLYGRLVGAAAVYARRRTSRGYVPATLTRRKGSRSSWVTLLTAEQITTMDATEGRPNVYLLAELSTVQFFIGRTEIAPLYSYVDVQGGVRTLKGESVTLRSMSQKRANSVLDTAASENADRWLKLRPIPYPNPSTRYSLIVSR